MKRIILACGLTAVVWIAAVPSAAKGQCTFNWRPGEPYRGLGGSVQSMANWDSDGDGPQPPQLILGGHITSAGGMPVSPGIVAFDGLHWSPIGDGVEGDVAALTVFHGDLIAGGSFAKAGGQFATNIARWDGNAWHALGLGVGSTLPFDIVNAMTVYNGDLIVGGRFVTAGGLTVNHIARWDGQAWAPLGTGVSGVSFWTAVYALIVFNGELIVGGTFESAGGVANTHGIARWNGVQWSSLGGGTDGSVFALEKHNSGLIAAGYFSMAGGVSAGDIARWTGSQWQALPNLSLFCECYISDVLSYNGYLVFILRTPDGPFSSWLYVWHENGTPWPGSFSMMDCTALGAFNGELYVGMDYPPGIYRWEDTGFRIPGTGMDAKVSALKGYMGELVAGGGFATAGELVVRYVARWNGVEWQSLGNGMNGPVAALDVYNGELIAGGDFTTAGDIARDYIARWNGTSWGDIGGGVGSRVHALTVYNGELIAAGDFLSAGGTSANRIARWDGNTWGPLGSGMNGSVTSLTVYNGQLIAGGNFTTAGGVSTNRIAAWNGANWQPLGTGMNGWVDALTVYNGELIAVGTFSTAGGVSVSNVARWNGSVWQGLGSGVNGRGSGVTIYNALLVVTGNFSSAGGNAANNIAAWNGSSWQPLGTGLDAYCLCAAVFNHELVVGGYFKQAGGMTSGYWARWGPTCLRGDMDCNSAVELADAPAFVEALLSADGLSDCEAYKANVNGDVLPDGRGKVDGEDVAAFVECVVKGCP